MRCLDVFFVVLGSMSFLRWHAILMTSQSLCMSRGVFHRRHSGAVAKRCPDESWWLFVSHRTYDVRRERIVHSRTCDTLRFENYRLLDGGDCEQFCVHSKASELNTFRKRNRVLTTELYVSVFLFWILNLWIVLSRVQVHKCQYQLIKSIKYTETIEHQGVEVLTGVTVQKAIR